MRTFLKIYMNTHSLVPASATNFGIISRKQRRDERNEWILLQIKQIFAIINIIFFYLMFYIIYCIQKSQCCRWILHFSFRLNCYYLNILNIEIFLLWMNNNKNRRKKSKISIKKLYLKTNEIQLLNKIHILRSWEEEGAAIILFELNKQFN